MAYYIHRKVNHIYAVGHSTDLAYPTGPHDRGDRTLGPGKRQEQNDHIKQRNPRVTY